MIDVKVIGNIFHFIPIAHYREVIIADNKNL